MFVWWRWRESNPRPKNSTQNDYKLSQSWGLAFPDLIDKGGNAEPVACASLMIVNGVAMGKEDMTGADNQFNTGRTAGICYTHTRDAYKSEDMCD